MPTSLKDDAENHLNGEYERLLEDLHDLAVVAERRDDETIRFEGMIGRLRYAENSQ